MRKYKIYNTSDKALIVRASSPEEALDLFIDYITLNCNISEIYNEIYFVEDGSGSTTMFYYEGGWKKFQLPDADEIEIEESLLYLDSTNF